jgi:hypothetical protein
MVRPGGDLCPSRNNRPTTTFLTSADAVRANQLLAGAHLYCFEARYTKFVPNLRSPNPCYVSLDYVSLAPLYWVSGPDVGLVGTSPDTIVTARVQACGRALRRLLPQANRDNVLELA